MACSLRSFKYLHPPIKGTRLHIKPPHRLNRGDLLRTPLRDHRIKLRPLDRLASAVHAVRLSNRNSLSLAVADVLTLELGQSCVGDRFGWFVDNCVPEAYAVEAREKGISVHKLLRQKTERLAPGESGLVALGSAMYAAAAAGIYPSVKEAAKKLAAPCAVCYTPNEENQAWYSALYREYVTMHDYFGRSGNDVMAQLMQR